MLLVHCTNCGQKINYDTAWRNSFTKGPVCDKECNDELNLKYAKAVLRPMREVKGE